MGLEQPGVVEGFPAHDRGLELSILRGAFQPKPLHVLWRSLMLFLAVLDEFITPPG